MKLILLKLEHKYRKHLQDMLDEWYGSGEKIIPYAIRRVDYHDFEHYLDTLEVREEDIPEARYKQSLDGL